MDSDIRDAMVSMLQSRDRLENGRGENDKVSGRMQETVETSAGEIRIGKAEEGSRKEIRRKR